MSRFPDLLRLRLYSQHLAGNPLPCPEEVVPVPRHFVVPADIRWLLRLSAPRVLLLNSHQYRNLEPDDRVFRRCHAVLERALRDGRQLTRTELGAAPRRSGVVASGQRGGYAGATS